LIQDDDHMTAPINESAATTFDLEIPHAGVTSSREPVSPYAPIVSTQDSNTATANAPVVVTVVVRIGGP